MMNEGGPGRTRRRGGGLDVAFDRETGAGNVYIAIDQFTGEVVYDGTPEQGNSFDQLWDDWSFLLHTGDFAGPLTRVVWTALALSPIALGATGLLMY
jgi:uncharacterized iron-regulated membrane protein